jgi:hypothetical protein
MPKLHGLSGHFHVLHQMAALPPPEVQIAAKAKLEDEIDYQAQYIGVLQILMKTLNDIIEATPEEVGSRDGGAIDESMFRDLQ